MDPPIGQSVTLSSPDHWIMGTLWFCEKVTGSTPPDAVVTWKDGDSVFALRPQPETNVHTPGDTETGKFLDFATSRCWWNIGGNVICKVKSWVEGMDLEADTIRAVQNQMPSVPVPKVIHSWLDEAWNRSFLLYERIPGQSLDDAWSTLSTDQVQKIAEDVAAHAITMAQSRSGKLQKITGYGVIDEDQLFNPPPFKTTPSWKPTVRPIFTPQTVTAHLLDLFGEGFPDVGEYFYFYHSTMDPRSVFVSVSGPEKEDVQVTAIINWDAAAYFPRWWIALKPQASFGFILGLGHKEEERWKWAETFSNTLIDKGFDCPNEWYLHANEYRNKQLEKVEGVV